MNNHEALAATIGARILQIDAAIDSEGVTVRTDRGVLTMHHDQDCCEDVRVEDVAGDPADCVGCVVVSFSEVVNPESAPPDSRDGPLAESFTWTFYNLRTTGGDLSIRWLGVSNGFYSEDVRCRWSPADVEDEADEA